MLMTAVLVMYMVVSAVSTMIMMMIVRMIVTAARPVRRMFMMVMVRGREQVERRTARAHRQGAGTHQA